MKALVGAFNQEKALVGAFSVIVKTNGLFAALIKTHVPMFQAGHLSLHPLLGRGEGGPGEQQECGQHAAVQCPVPSPRQLIANTEIWRTFSANR